MKIGVFCYHDEPYKCVADVTMPVLRRYCERHGYGLHVSENETTERGILWKLVPDLLGGMEHYDWVVHLNTDTLITNHSFRIDQLLNRHFVIPMVLNADLEWTLNDGFLAVKNSDEGRWLLRETWGMFGAPNSLAGNRDGKVTCPLNALEAMHRTSRSAQAMMYVVPQNWCNSFLYTEYGLPETTPGHWQPGDFILHLPGRTNARRVELFTQWLPNIKW
jgi:hypothetical protein